MSKIEVYGSEDLATFLKSDAPRQLPRNYRGPTNSSSQKPAKPLGRAEADDAFFQAVANNDYYLYKITTDPKILPSAQSSSVNIVVSKGWGWYWTKTSGVSWSMNPAAGYHGPEGFPHQGDGGYFYDAANAGALTSEAGQDDKYRYFTFYTREFDRSYGGTSYWYNNDISAILLSFAINDRLKPQDYQDNEGFMNHDLVVFRII